MSNESASSGKEDDANKPEKINKPKKTKYGRYASDITKEELEACFDLPAEDAAVVLGVGSTMLKRLSRKFGIRMWPYRRMQIEREHAAGYTPTLHINDANGARTSVLPQHPGPLPPKSDDDPTGPCSVDLANDTSQQIPETTAGQQALPSLPVLPPDKSNSLDLGRIIQEEAAKKLPGRESSSAALPPTAPTVATNQDTMKDVAGALIRAALAKFGEGNHPDDTKSVKPPPPPFSLGAPPTERSSVPLAGPSRVIPPTDPPVTSNSLTSSTSKTSMHEVNLLKELIGKLQEALKDRIGHAAPMGGGAGIQPLPPPPPPPPVSHQRPPVETGTALDILADASFHQVTSPTLPSASHAAPIMLPPPSAAAAAPPGPGPPGPGPRISPVEMALYRVLALQHVNDQDFVRATLSKALLQLMPPPGVDGNKFAVNH